MSWIGEVNCVKMDARQHLHAMARHIFQQIGECHDHVFKSQDIQVIQLVQTICSSLTYHEARCILRKSRVVHIVIALQRIRNVKPVAKAQPTNTIVTPCRPWSSGSILGFCSTLDSSAATRTCEPSKRNTNPSLNKHTRLRIIEEYESARICKSNRVR